MADVSSMAGVFQLDELEDTCTTTTLLQLEENGSVSVGKTDGPIPLEAKGEWASDQTSKTLMMTIERKFLTDDDRFEFTVKRTYEGEISQKDSYVEVDGKIIDKFPVGYFKLFSAAWEDDGAASSE